jgi:O-antigen/teichoic acid export membrane protein
MLKKNLLHFAGWNLVTLISTSLVSLFYLPVYVNQLSAESFSILTILWSILSVGSILDFGLGRTIIREFSILRSTQAVLDYTKCGELLTTTLLVALKYSLYGLIVTFLLTYSYSQIVAGKLGFTTMMCIYIALCVFFTIYNNSVLSILEGSHLIKYASLIRSFFTILFFAVPAQLLIQKIILTTEKIILVIFLIRLIQGALLTFLVYHKYHLPKIRYSKKIASRYVSFGKWLTISNFVSVIMTYGDRFVMGYTLEPIHIVNYSIANDLVQKGTSVLNLIPNSLYPLIASSDINKYSLRNLRKIIIFLSAIVISGSLVSLLAADFFLRFWLEENYEEEITTLFKILLVAWASSGFGQLFLSRMHSIGNMKSPAMLNVIECVFYLPLIFIAIKIFGVYGAAVMYSIRFLVDAFILCKIVIKNEKS